MFEKYDVIVVGAGHAGCEAAYAAANMGAKVLLTTMNLNTIAQMSCNPAMGGVAKGQILREIDALNGASGIVTDETMIQFRMLNRSKGPAMWSPRAQSDRVQFHIKWRQILESHPKIDFWQELIRELIVEENRCIGVITALGLKLYGNSVILTNGTFLNGIIHIGEKQFGGGRMAESSAKGLTEQLITLGFEAGRMKTGTPPRVDGRSLDYTKMEIQHGDNLPSKFSFTSTTPLVDQVPCHISYTSTKVHEILKTGFEKSPMFKGRIQGLGPRYCPSIEDKINRFADKDRHQLFIEPEGRNTCEIYVNGFSSSLPEDVQYSALKEVPGFENFKMLRPGYAIEYDFFPPTQLSLSLETHKISNLFFAGQINGTTGYEEAAAQGLIAGINAAQKAFGLEKFVLSRADAYIGVLIDDLVTKGTNEPYRMFTSRAEFRILLRQDNADIRLTHKAELLGMDVKDRMDQVANKKQSLLEISQYFEKESVSPSEINCLLTDLNSSPLTQKVKLVSLLTRPFIQISSLAKYLPSLDNFLQKFTDDQIEHAEVDIKYRGYIDKEREMVEKMNRLEEVYLRPDFDYSCLKALSIEAREKLSKNKPNNIGQAGRISGVSPSDIAALLIAVGR